MFKKHTTLIIALLAVSVSAGTDHALSTPHDMGSIPTFAGKYSRNSRLETTLKCISATFQPYIATVKVAVPTFSANPGDFHADAPTVFPQQAAIQLASSTGHDYTTPSVSAQEQKMVNLLNQDRKINGLSTLPLDAELCRIARLKSADMRDHRYFAHESPTYGNVRNMLKQFGYPFSGASENIAHHANVDKAQAAFMSSSGHRANILSAAWTKVGVGIVLDAQGYIYATQIFAR